MTTQTVQTVYGLARVELRSYVVKQALAVCLVDAYSGEPVATLSCNLPEHAATLAAGEFFCKVWGGNEDLVADLLASGLFEDTGRRVPTGFVRAQVWRLAGALRPYAPLTEAAFSADPPSVPGRLLIQSLPRQPGASGPG